MSAARWDEVGRLFDELCELAAAARAERLAEIARTDRELADELRALLAADDRADDLLEGGALAALPELGAGAAPADRRAGAYRLLRPLGEGGMGVVWLGERVDGAYEQQVAVKLIKRGMDTQAILRRFLQERRILARLRHPHIVRLLDGGVAADGRPFYVMDRVDGEPITQHAARQRLDPAARVRLLLQVTDAVAHAHAQLVVHRDLKPSNVLVDASGSAHVLDFGIAKLLEDSGEAAVTGTAQRVLSPAYAAPEQILGEPVGTAADVYTLGLMLCELLVGELPLRRHAASPQQLARDAAEESAERVSTLAARLPRERLAQLYGDEVDRARLLRRLAGDLDVIVATATQRDPLRRYPTAAAFADDLQRWLDGRPIRARADSRSYRLRKFVRRHRVGVAATALIALALVGGLGAALWQARLAREQAQRADLERAHAERQLARAERVKQFVLTLFREQDPVARAKVQARSAPELIRDGIAQIDAGFGRQPDLQAELLRDLGEIQLGLDERKAAQETLRRAWELQTRLSGEGSADSAEALAAYADAIYAGGDTVEAGKLLRKAVERLRSTRGADDVKTAKAEASLATIEMIQSRYADAERLAAHAVAVYRARFGADDSEVAQRLLTLGVVQQEAARYADALSSYGEALRITSATQGAEHVRTVSLRTRIADVLRVQRRYDEALPHYETALRIERAQLPAGHTLIAGTLLRLGDLQRRMRRYDEAERSLAEAVTILAATPSGQYAQALQFQAVLARAQGRHELAVRRYRASIDAFRAATRDSAYTWLTAFSCVETLAEAGRYAEADALAAEAAAGLARLPQQDPYAKTYAASVNGALRHAQGRFDEAIAARRAALAGLVTIYGEPHAEVAQARIALADSLVATHALPARDEAAPLLQQAQTALEASADEERARMLGGLYLTRARLRVDAGDAASARTDLTQALARLDAPADAGRRRDAQVLLARLDTASSLSQSKPSANKASSAPSSTAPTSQPPPNGRR